MANTNQEAVTEGDFFIEGGVPGEMGKGYGGDGDTEEADGKLNETKCVIEAGDRSIGQVGGKVAIDHNVDLDGGGSDRCRAEKSKNLFEARIVPDDEPAGLVAEGDGSGNHDEPLGETADEDADGKTVDGALTEGGVEDPGEEEVMRNKKFWERENERVLDLYIDEKRALQYKHALKKNGALQKGDKGELLFSEEGEIALLKELKELDQKIFKEEIEVRVYKILEDNCKGLKRFHKEELSELGFI